MLNYETLFLSANIRSFLIAHLSFGQNMLRSGVGFSIYNADPDSKKLMTGPSLYTEYSYQALPFLGRFCVLSAADKDKGIIPFFPPVARTLEKFLVYLKVLEAE